MSLYLGLMSGTSLDGVDAAVVRLGGRGERPEPAEPVHFLTVPYGDAFRERLARAVEDAGPREICELGFELGRRFAGAASRALGEAGVDAERLDAVGSHGQTLWHSPPGGGEPGSTLQVGEPAVIAEELGTDVVADFRVRDVAAAGHGAPLTPYFDRLLLSHPERTRAVQNLGGMGNVTLLPPGGGSTADAGAARPRGSDAPAGGTTDSPPPLAFDTGPGVALLDAAVEALTGGDERMDAGGRRAARGEVLEGALEEWLADPFFAREPPKSTGRERFGRGRVRRWLERHDGQRPADLLATLTELTARSVSAGLEAAPASVDELYLCGGGAENPELARRVRAAVGEGVAVRRLEALGWSGEAREAAAFALMARQHLLGVEVDLSWATGAAGARRLGKRVPA